MKSGMDSQHSSMPIDPTPFGPNSAPLRYLSLLLVPIYAALLAGGMSTSAWGQTRSENVGLLKANPSQPVTALRQPAENDPFTLPTLGEPDPFPADRIEPPNNSFSQPVTPNSQPFGGTPPGNFNDRGMPDHDAPTDDPFFQPSAPDNWPGPPPSPALQQLKDEFGPNPNGSDLLRSRDGGTLDIDWGDFARPPSGGPLRPLRDFPSDDPSIPFRRNPVSIGDESPNGFPKENAPKDRFPTDLDTDPLAEPRRPPARVDDFSNSPEPRRNRDRAGQFGGDTRMSPPPRRNDDSFPDLRLPGVDDNARSPARRNGRDPLPDPDALRDDRPSNRRTPDALDDPTENDAFDDEGFPRSRRSPASGRMTDERTNRGRPTGPRSSDDGLGDSDFGAPPPATIGSSTRPTRRTPSDRDLNSDRETGFDEDGFAIGGSRRQPSRTPRTKSPSERGFDDRDSSARDPFPSIDSSNIDRGAPRRGTGRPSDPVNGFPDQVNDRDNDFTRNPVPRRKPAPQRDWPLTPGIDNLDIPDPDSRQPITDERLRELRQRRNKDLDRDPLEGDPFTSPPLHDLGPPGEDDEPVLEDKIATRRSRINRTIAERRGAPPADDQLPARIRTAIPTQPVSLVAAKSLVTTDDGKSLNPVLFERVRDKTIGFTYEDRPAFFEGLALARDLPPADLRRHAADFRQLRQQASAKYRNRKPEDFPVFVDVFNNPKAYRGQPVTLHGHLRKLTRYNPGVNARGINEAYEGWLYTADSQTNPAVVIFTEKPAGLEIGGDLAEEVVVSGYFLKMYGYDAQDTTRIAPLFVAGPVEWIPARVKQEWVIPSWFYALGAFAAFWLVAAVWGRQIDRQGEYSLVGASPLGNNEPPPNFDFLKTDTTRSSNSWSTSRSELQSTGPMPATTQPATRTQTIFGTAQSTRVVTTSPQYDDGYPADPKLSPRTDWS